MNENQKYILSCCFTTLSVLTGVAVMAIWRENELLLLCGGIVAGISFMTLMVKLLKLAEKYHQSTIVSSGPCIQASDTRQRLSAEQENSRSTTIIIISTNGFQLDNPPEYKDCVDEVLPPPYAELYF